MENKENILEKQLQLSNLTLWHLTQEMQVLVNGFVNKVQSLDSGWVKMKVHTKQFGDKNLLITPQAFFISNESVPAKQNPGGFSALMKKYLFNQRIVSLTQPGLDRLVFLSFLMCFWWLNFLPKEILFCATKNYR